MKTNVFTGIFLALMLVTSLAPLASADSSWVETWVYWVVNGQMSETNNMNANEGENVKIGFIIDAKDDFLLNIDLLDKDKKFVKHLVDYAGYESYSSTKTFKVNTAGTYYVKAYSSDSSGASSLDEIKLTVKKVNTGCSDVDSDKICDTQDNCPTNYNPFQEDLDKDSQGDYCDNDIDGDEITNDKDKCPNSPEDQDGYQDNDGCPEENPCTDTDKDGLCDSIDNCYSVPNPNQQNSDGDEWGNACDKCVYVFDDVIADADNDGLGNNCDNCVFVNNPDQKNLDGDKYGDVCDSDIDGDGISNALDDCDFEAEDKDGYQDNDGCPEAGSCDDKDKDGVCDNIDNCPNKANSNQADLDKDKIGDTCDSDVDGDGINNANDACPLQPEDFDGYKDTDGCPEPGSCDDADKDGICDKVDNCPNIANPTQTDLDNDGLGNVCDSDPDGDNVVNDACPLQPEDFDGYKDTDGCPEGDAPCKDTDKDGICDKDDACPTDPTNKCNDNLAPQLTISGHTETQEKHELSLNIKITDKQLNTLKVQTKKCLIFGIFCGLRDAPVGSKLTGIGKNAYTFSWTPDYTFVQHPKEEKETILIFTANDGKLSQEAEVKVTVTDVNQLPKLSVEDNSPFAENKEVSIIFTATDLDAEDELEVSVSSGQNLPSWLEIETIDNQLQVKGTPDCEDAGDYEFEVLGTDGIATQKMTYKFNVAEACSTPLPDTDADGVPDATDNCPNVANPDQLDTDADGIGDACEEVIPPTDTDGDGIADENDNCPLVANVDQLDTDADGTGDACEEVIPPTPTDTDSDGIADENDNCPLVANVDQLDIDADGTGDACEEVVPPVVNHAPKLLSNPLTSATKDKLYTYQIKVADSDSDALEIELSKAPKGMTLSQNGLVQWTPETESDAKVIIEITDGNYLVKQEFTVHVAEAKKAVKFSSVKLGSDVVSAGDYLSMQINMANNGDEELKDLKVSTTIYELGLKLSSKEFDLEPGEKMGKNINLQLPYDVEPGEYLVEVMIDNGHFHDVVYRPIFIQ